VISPIPVSKSRRRFGAQASLIPIEMIADIGSLRMPAAHKYTGIL
jgi:hypothetical protein